MPTGYTIAIEEGATFEEYAWRCARAFGACVMMREDPIEKPVPEAFEPHPYYRDKLREIGEQSRELGRITTGEVVARIAAETADVDARNGQLRQEAEEKRARYEAMADRVESWEPPTPDHAPLKAFMLDQIRISTRDLSPCKIPAPEQDPTAWLAGKLAKLAKDREYHARSWEEEVERTRARNEWVAQLRASIPQPG